VGSSSTSSAEGHGFFWERGTMVDIGTLPGGTSSDALAINKRGEVAAISNSPGGSALFLWQNGNVVDTGIEWTPRGESSAQILNNRSEVVGLHTTASGETHGALWTRRGFRHDHEQ
jgi:probable HAF family extracellular repeat protein